MYSDKGAQVQKGGGGQRRLGKKPKFVAFIFLKPSLTSYNFKQQVASDIGQHLLDG